MQQLTPMARAAEVAGGQTALAEACGVSVQAVNQWVRGVRPLPIERCADIERITGGVVSRRDLRPSDWRRIWPELAEANPATPIQEQEHA